MATLHRWGYALVTLFLVAGIRTLELIPFYKVKGPFKDSLFGKDFLNLYLFHHCPQAQGNFYAVSGTVCGDPGGRSMIYPPWNYYAFDWVSFFDYPTALYLWS